MSVETMRSIANPARGGINKSGTVKLETEKRHPSPHIAPAPSKQTPCPRKTAYGRF
jgi:hypothetical protein